MYIPPMKAMGTPMSVSISSSLKNCCIMFVCVTHADRHGHFVYLAQTIVLKISHSNDHSSNHKPQLSVYLLSTLKTS